MSSRLERVGLGILRHPRGVAGLTLALALLAALGLFRLRIDPNVEHLLPVDDPTLTLTRQLQGDAPATRTLFVILRGDDVRVLEDSLPSIVESLRASSVLVRVEATREEFAGARADWARQSPLHFLPEETLTKLESRLTGPGRLAELKGLQGRMAADPLGGKALALADPLDLRWIFHEAADRVSDRFPARFRPGSPYLVVEQPPLAFLRVVGREDSSNTRASQELLEDLRSRIERSAGGKGIRAEFAGGYVSAVTQAAALRRDMIVETVVSSIAVLLYVWWFARSLLAAHLVFVPVLLSIAGSLAIGGALFGSLTPIVVSAAAILIAQGIDFPVHYFCRYRTERRSRDREGALHAAQVAMARPFMGIAATTLVAFLSLLVSRFPGFRQFGFVLAVGLVLCLIAALVVFPLLLIPIDRLVKPESERRPWVVRGAEAVLRTRWRVPLAWLIAILGLASWAWVAHAGVRMDLDLRSAMAPDDPGRAALETLERDLGAALIPVHALVDSAMPAEELRTRVAALRASGAIAAADGPQDWIPSAATRERVQAFRRRTEGWMQGTLAELAGLGFRPDPFRKGLEEMEARFAAPAPRLEDLDRPGFESLRRVARTELEGRTWTVVVLFSAKSIWREAGRQEFDRGIREQLGGTLRLYSPFHLPDHYSDLLNSDLKRVLWITAAGIVLLTLLSVGNLKDGLYALAPVVLATGMTLAMVILLGGRVNVINMAALPIILAVGVDGGIHFMVRFRESRDRDPAETIREVGPGIWGSAATTLLGFGSIASSVTPGMASLGYLVVVGTLTSVLASLFLLPGILKRRTLPPA